MKNFVGSGYGRSTSYVALLQPHLDVIQVFLRDDKYVNSNTGAQLGLKCDSAGKDRLIISERTNHSLKYDSDDHDRRITTIVLPRPVKVEGQSVTASFSDGAFDFKVSARCSEAKFILEDPRLSAKELQDYAPDHIQCRFCSVSLITVGTSATARPIFRPLPSPHYQELIEAYLCHPSGEFAKKMDDVGEKGFWPENTIVDGQIRPVILVGETELRADGQHVEEWLRLAEVDTAKSPLLASRWDDIHCQCGAMIGERNAHRFSPSKPIEGPAIRQTVKLWKHSIRLSTSSGSSLSYPPEVFVMTEILSLAQAHSTRRFQVYDTEDEGHESPRVMLWLFQPDMIISYGSSDEPATISQVAKILYTCPEPSSSGSLGQRDNLQVESVVYPKAIVDAVITSLRATTELLPTRHRSMGSHRVGFLARR